MFIAEFSGSEQHGCYLVCNVNDWDTKDGLVIYKVNCRQAREGALGHHGESAGMEQMLENFKQEQEQISMTDLT